MPCSRCRQSGHNARNKRCPALNPSFTSTPNGDNGLYISSQEYARLEQAHEEHIRQEYARLEQERQERERQEQERQERLYYEHEHQQMIQFLREYEHVHPSMHSRQLTERGSLLLYKMYLLPRDLMSNPRTRCAIIDHFIHPVTRHVRARRLISGESYYVALGVLIDNRRRCVILSSGEYPINRDVYLIIPQIQGVTISETYELYYTRRRLASSYVKEWKVILGDIMLPIEQECVICMETKAITHFTKTNCLHEYCVDCMKSHIQSNKYSTTKIVCPMCRSDLHEICVNDVNTYSTLQDFIVRL